MNGRVAVPVALAALLLIVVLAGLGGSSSDPGAPGPVITPAIASARAGVASYMTPPRRLPPAPVQVPSDWLYQPDPGNIGLSGSWGQGGAPSSGWTVVTVPNDFNPVVDRAGNRGQVGWYETAFVGPPESAGRTWRLAFEGVRRYATVFLNGYELGTNSNPYDSFSFPATTLLPGAANTLIVRVDNFRGAGAFPEDWRNWGGITGPVTLEPAGRLSIEHLGVTPQLGCHYRCGALQVQGTVIGNSPGRLGAVVSVRVRSPSGTVFAGSERVTPIARGGASPVSFRVVVRSPALWAPAHPALYSVDVRVVSSGHVVEQEQRLSVGMRSVAVRSGILYLNGRRLWLHGASIHEDIPGHGAALTDADIRTIVRQLKAVHANVTRAHYELSPRLLDALDRAGIMVWAQAPIDHADVKLQTASGRARALALLRATLLADRNHPSVIVDSVGNELSPTPDTTPDTRSYLVAAIALARQLNPGVPVGLDTYCYTGFGAQQLYKQLDVLGISHYFGWYPGVPGHSIASFGQLAPFLRLTHARYPRLALVVAEYGAEAFYRGAPRVKGTYAFQTNYIQQTLSVLDRLPFMNGQIYWTLRDYAIAPGWLGGATPPSGYVPDGIHHKGLIAYDGGKVKPAFAVARRLFALLPAYVTRASFGR
ncbi:MAG: glycoside hydrolase family 2 protein [Solirubrobacteraceae bacterium]